MLSLQDKLALALTSAGSQRKLAAALGVSHQKVGRWLRAGQPAIIDPTTGYVMRAKAPESVPIEAAPIINAAFKLHISVTKDQAKADGLPFNPESPAFAFRGIMKNGEKGERVIVENTEFIKPDLRQKIITDAGKSKKYLQVSVRSKVRLKDYARKAAEKEIEGGRRFETDNSLSKKILQTLLKTNKVIVADDDILPIFTKYESLQGRNAANSVEKKLSSKHEASAESLADEYLFQVMPEKRRRQSIEKQTNKPRAKPRKR